MFDPYRMVVVNAIASSLLFIGVLLYRFVFPQKRIHLFTLLILLSILPTISIFRNGDYESGDFNIHIYRVMEFFDSIKDGQLLPSWSENLNALYGYPLFIFLNPLPYYILSLLHFIGFSFIASMKLYLAATFTISGITMYVLLKKLTQSDVASFVGSITYIFAPYHLVNTHFRATVGETTTAALFPLCLWFLLLYKEKKTSTYLLLSGTLFGLLFLAHQATAFLFMSIAIIYIAYCFQQTTTKTYSLFLALFLPFLIGLLLSLYSWLPHLTYSQFTHAEDSTKGNVAFPDLLSLLYSPWRMGFLFQGPNGELSLLVGYTQLLVIIGTFFVLLFHRQKTFVLRYQLFWIIVLCGTTFMMTPLSSFIWNLFPTLKTMQFASRFMVVVVFITSVLASYLSLYFSKKPVILYIFSIITIVYTMLNWGHRQLIPQITDDTLYSQLWISTASGEGLLCCITVPKWVDRDNPWKDTKPETPLAIAKGSGEITAIKRTSVLHTYVINARTSLQAVEQTLYFPGWHVALNDQPISFEYKHPNTQGLISFTVPKGTHYLEIFYKDLPMLAIAKILSSGGFMIIGMYFSCRGFCFLQRKLHVP